MVVDIRTWVKNVVNQPPTVASNDVIVPLTTPTMSAKAVLICRPNSHPFQERTLTLDQPVKVGRSVARARATPTNAIFDCKVLSRHHALLWYKDGKFYLQDTKSSNGTFVNNNRLSPGGFESVPHEVCSGDIVQFGVDVVENNRKVTHGCIVATLKLYLHDGKEAKASHSLSVGSNIGSVPLDELYKLNQYLQDALQREQMLETKLSTLQNLVDQARESTNLSWQIFIGEDRLLSRVEILESQLLAYSKNYSEDKIREELLRLQEEKNEYQNTAKENLRNLHQERLDAINKLTSVEQQLHVTEEEINVFKERYEKAQEELQELAQRVSAAEMRESELTSQLAASEEREQEGETKVQEVLDRIDSLNATIQDMVKQTDKLKQDKYVLRTLITELDKCTLNNCPVEIKFKVDKILSESMLDDNTTKLEEIKSECDIEEKIEDDENHKDINVPLTNELESNKEKEMELDGNTIINEDLNIKLEENHNKSDNLEIKEDLTNWQLTSQLGGVLNENTKLQEEILCESSVDNKRFLNNGTPYINTIKQELTAAQNEIIEKTVTISKMSDEIENLLESSAMVNAKMNILENDLLEEKQICEKYKHELESLKNILMETEKLTEESKEEESRLRKQIDELIKELETRPTVEAYEQLKCRCKELELSSSINSNAIPELKEQRIALSYQDPTEDKRKINELEEELVLMKEQYSKCNDDKILLNKQYEKLQKEYYYLTNRSYNVMFFYIAPLVFLIAYLLFAVLFS